MAASDDLGRWAAAFLQHYAQEDRAAVPTGESSDAPTYFGVTQEAVVLLESVDRGGVPAFITQHLLRIARDNGVTVATDTTPNDIVASLRQMATRAGDS